MAKRIILCTIPGTGTHFFKKLLEDHGFDVKAIHCTDNGLNIVRDEIVNGSTLVTTWRYISDIYKSWDKNNRDLNADDYLEGWYRLFQWEPVVVSFDSDKEARLELLSAVLGVELKTDWEPVNATPKKKYDIHTDTFKEDMCAAYAFAVDAGHPGGFDEYKAWRAKEDEVVNE